MSSSYSTSDFKYSMLGGTHEGISVMKLGRPVQVLYAYGNVDDPCCEQCGGDWDGGFVVKLASGMIAHIKGWCDYTGWGCQDGVTVTMHTSIKTLEVDSRWDKDPADLNNQLPKLLEEIKNEEMW